MKYDAALTVIYNGLLNDHQFKTCEMIENSLPNSSRNFRSEKMRENLTNEISSLSQMAYDLGEHALAESFMLTAKDFGSDAIAPMPLACSDQCQ
ncbi:MAG: hypothetical protein JKY55_18395 [Aliivibrio sp.]|uniref:hypothetical protein n=1 Tax=Aliivibrio sp. TaxID=1872443 RepID=UPI001A5AC557|nr:hypothetical protein [Aliivibrio sp.]